MATRSYAYNTRKKTPEQLEKELVGSERWDILNGILNELSLKKGERPKQHWMIVGPRGIGKSHLLTLLYYKIKNNPKLTKKWITVLFPEELRMANDLAKFLERTVKEILLELEKEKSPIAEELKHEINKIKEIRVSERIEHLFTVLNWIHRSSGKYILLLFENLQKLLGEKISIIEQKKLRAFLQTYENVLLIGSATTVFNALHDHKHPFYHFFHIRRLTDLNFDEMKILITNILADDNRQDIAVIVAKNEARMKALYSFTGGNPRMAVFLSEILRTEVPDEMIGFMDEILEDLTPYFEAILNDTPDYMEEIMNTLAIHEPAQSPKEIAGHLEMQQTTIRNYLKQMKDNGYVRVAFSKGKSNFYCLNEYLYRIWYQMRDSSHREETRWLMELLMMLYSPKAIMEEKSKLDKCNMDGITYDSYKMLIFKTADFMDRHPEYCKVIELCIDSTSIDKEVKTRDKRENELHNKAQKYRENRQYSKAIEEIKKILDINPDASYAYWGWGDCLRKMNQYDQAIIQFKKSLEVTPDYYAAYGAIGDCLRELKQYQEAEVNYKKAIEINPKYEDAYFAWSSSLIMQKRYKEAIEKYKEILKILPDLERSYIAWGNCLGLQRNYNEAITKFKKALKINMNSEKALAGLIYALGDSKQYYEAIKIIEKHNSILKNCLVIVQYGKCLFEIGRYDDALEQFEKLLELHYNCSKVFMLYGMTLEKLGKKEDALISYITHIGCHSSKSHIDIGVFDSFNKYVLPILQNLKPETYIKPFYIASIAKFSKPQLGIFLVLLGKYDIVSEYFETIVKESEGKEKKEKFDFSVFIAVIRLCIWLKLMKDKFQEAQRLVELYAEYIKQLKTDKEREEEVSRLILSLFKLQVHMNVKKENIHQILEQFKNTGVPFSELFFKVWTCLSDPDSIDAQRYLSDKAIAELVEQVKKKDESSEIECG